MGIPAGVIAAADQEFASTRAFLTSLAQAARERSTDNAVADVANLGLVLGMEFRPQDMRMVAAVAVWLLSQQSGEVA